MAAASLVERDIGDGEKLVRHLDKDGFPVSAAFWYYESEPDKWRLIIASSIVDEQGSTKAYGRLFESIRRLEKKSRGRYSLDSFRIQLVKKRDRLPALLKRAVKTGPGISGIRFTGNAIDGTLIDDAYIYRVA